MPRRPPQAVKQANDHDGNLAWKTSGFPGFSLISLQRDQNHQSIQQLKGGAPLPATAEHEEAEDEEAEGGEPSG